MHIKQKKFHSIIIKYDRNRSDQKDGQSIRLTRYNALTLKNCRFCQLAINYIEHETVRHNHVLPTVVKPI